MLKKNYGTSEFNAKRKSAPEDTDVSVSCIVDYWHINMLITVTCLREFVKIQIK